MEILDLPQGSSQWLAHRAKHFNASDAPAMMGCSPYKTRSQLLQDMHTGVLAEVDPAQQRRFDDGHRFEALARPLAEELLGDDLYPVVGVDGRYSASFDGLTMCGTTAFEHKSLNDELRAAMREGCTGAELPLPYRVQMEQQCMVSGCRQVLFMASKWDGDDLVEARQCMYEPDLALRARIVGGWQQLEADLASFVPTTPVVPAMAAPQETLPAVSVRVDGQLAIVSNLPAFGEALRSFIAGIPTEPSTDQEFADTEAACKALKRAEDALEAAESNALAQLSDVDTMRRFIADYRALARTTRLQREKLVEARKAALRIEIVQQGVTALGDHLRLLNDRIGRPFMPQVHADFAGAIKGKKTVASLRDAVTVALTDARVEANAIADRIQVNLRLVSQRPELAFLFPDVRDVVLKAADDCAALVGNRIATHEAAEAKRLEAERERIRREEQDRIRTEEHERAERAERAASEAAAVALAAAAVPAPPAAATFAPATVASTTTVESGAPPQPRITTASAAPVGPPTLRLGVLNERLAPINVTADGLRQLGFEPAGRDRSAQLFHEHQFPLICGALAEHLQRLAEPVAA